MKRPNPLLLLLCVLFVCGCAVGPGDSTDGIGMEEWCRREGGSASDLDDVEPPPSIPVRTSQFEGVILLLGDWVPTEKEVLALEEQLVAYLIQQQDAFDSLQAPIEERLPTYRRQYWGVLENKERLIVANFFCDASHTEWTERVVTVLDGGDCYFRVRYDPEAGTFSDLEVNGSA